MQLQSSSFPLWARPPELQALGPPAFRSLGLRGAWITSCFGIQRHTCTPTVRWAPRLPAATSWVEADERGPEGQHDAPPPTTGPRRPSVQGPGAPPSPRSAPRCSSPSSPRRPGGEGGEAAALGRRGGPKRRRRGPASPWMEGGGPGTDVPLAQPRRSPTSRGSAPQPAQPSSRAAAPTGRARPFRRRSRRRGPGPLSSTPAPGSAGLSSLFHFCDEIGRAHV